MFDNKFLEPWRVIDGNTMTNLGHRLELTFEDTKGD
jgi:hypothetical protein